MRILKFSELDAAQKRAVFWLADKAETLTPFILGAVSHPGELWEAQAFMMHFGKGTREYMQLVNRLRLGSASCESILACIYRVAPSYTTLGEGGTAGLNNLTPALKNVSVGL